MPQVASDPKVHVSHHNMPRIARPAPADRASSPFDSLIEETSPPADPAPPPPESKVAKSDDKQAAAKGKDCKSSEAASDTKPAKPDEVNPPGGPPPDEGVTEACDKKTASPKVAIVVGDEIQPGTDHKQAADQKGDNSNATQPGDDSVIVAASDAITVAPTATQAPGETQDAGEQVEQPLQQLALVADARPKIKQPGEDFPKAVVGKKAGDDKQVAASDHVEADKPVGDAQDPFQIMIKDASQHAEGKPQTGPDDGDKHHASQGRGDFMTTGHRSDAAAPTPPGADVSAAAKASNDVPTQPPIPNAGPHASENATAPAALVSQTGPQPAAVPLSGVAIEIAGKALAGKNRFDIRLDPPELGRIDVRLDVDRDGNVTSRLTVDRQDTLDLLRRDAAGLERALQDAGLKTANNGLQFSLRDQSLNDQQAGRAPDTALLVANDEALPVIDIMPQRYDRLAGQGGGLDIRV